MYSTGVDEQRRTNTKQRRGGDGTRTYDEDLLTQTARVRRLCARATRSCELYQSVDRSLLASVVADGCVQCWLWCVHRVCVSVQQCVLIPTGQTTTSPPSSFWPGRANNTTSRPHLEAQIHALLWLIIVSVSSARATRRQTMRSERAGAGTQFICFAARALSSRLLYLVVFCVCAFDLCCTFSIWLSHVGSSTRTRVSSAPLSDNCQRLVTWLVAR